MNMKPTALAALSISLVALSAVADASEELARSSNCLACHKVEGKLLGPSFQEIAAKYRDDDAAADTLVDKVKAGGVGVWGQIPMPPNPQVSDVDARTLVEWLLSL